MRVDESLDVDEAPDTVELARRLGVDGEHLQRFERSHPDAQPEYILRWADAGPEHREAVAAWLAARERKRDRQARRFWGGGS
jgi:hypothetical protein